MKLYEHRDHVNFFLFQMGFALFFNILAVIVSAIGTVVLIIFTAVLNQVVDYYNRETSDCVSTDGYCKCIYNDSGDEIDCKYNAQKCGDIWATI